MTLDEYQIHCEKTAIYPEKGTRSIKALAYLGLGMGEAGEVQGTLKKFIRGDYGDTMSDETVEEIALEIGDTLWYCAMLAREIGVPLGLVGGMNLAKLARRKMRGTLQGDGDHR